MPNTFNGQISTELYEDEYPHKVIASEVETRVPDDWSNATKELLDSLPQVWTRGLLYFLVVFVTIVLPWTMLSKVDETGTAKGRLEPKDNTVRLDAAVAGTVAEIRVKEGEVVKVGQTLLLLQSDLANAELYQAQEKLEGQFNQLSQLNLLKSQLLLTLETQRQQNQAQELAKQAQIDQARQSIHPLMNSYSFQKEENMAQVNQARQTLAYNQNAKKSMETRLALAQLEVERYQKARQENVVSEVDLVEKQDVAQERKNSYEQAKSNIKQAKLALVEKATIYKRNIKQLKADIEQAQLRVKEQEQSYQSLIQTGKLAILKTEEQLKNQEKEIAAIKAEIYQNKSQIEALKFQLEQRVLVSPVNGTVFHIPIQGAGAVAQPGTNLVEIAPLSSPLLIRAQMATTESGFLQKGMPVKLKFDAYPFQDYGVVEGKLIKISPTTSDIETPNGKVAAYNLEISLNRSCIPTANKCIPLRPGDTATAEVIVRQRRIIDFILEPFKNLQQGGLKL
ncbi:HlyD family efflux transporter periplasmic adaptor subunit [Acaryochloris sp. IP29b_bin.137]|uniref:HlyD family efflux transporter periplasmic adaptor subunit n=1 Tax=Acaryochloris sp. IP29b_bin.137 TaxID=2969217 RepID=UPI002629DC31|nr:HlyD family efflux transporter periplasmic adaptor subunit [Acaryochloris sp. IP29b_bin.137]